MWNRSRLGVILKSDTALHGQRQGYRGRRQITYTLLTSSACVLNHVGQSGLSNYAERLAFRSSVQANRVSLATGAVVEHLLKRDSNESVEFESASLEQDVSDSGDAISLEDCDNGSWSKSSRRDSLQDTNEGSAMMDGVVAVWGLCGKYCFFIGLGIMVIALYISPISFLRRSQTDNSSELDASTTTSYETYALSEFKDLSMKGTLEVLGAILAASVKVPIAKISDVIGRGETYCLMILLLIISYITHACSQGFRSFLLGSIPYIIGSAGIGLLDFIVISDVTSMHTRALAGSLLYAPYLLTTWIAGNIVENVKDGVGWRWGYGMFAVIIPLAASMFVLTLMILQRKAMKAGYAVSRRTSIGELCSRIDLGGSLLLSTGFGFVLLPITLAAQSHDHWKSAWIIILMVTGIVLLICLIPYEAFLARHPVLPMGYFRSRAIMVAFLVCCIDSCGYRVTHTYLFPWSIAAHNLSARSALYLLYINGLTQLVTSIFAGWIMMRTRSYKWMSVSGSLIRAFGYGLMIRLRTNDSTTAELFTVQIIQGVGSGFLECSMFMSAQIVVPHAELAQVTALIAMASHMGGGIGAAVAGGIYTTAMKGRLRARLGIGVDDGRIEDLFDSITGTLPEWGSKDRVAVAAAVSCRLRELRECIYTDGAVVFGCRWQHDGRSVVCCTSGDSAYAAYA